MQNATCSEAVAFWEIRMLELISGFAQCSEQELVQGHLEVFALERFPLGITAHCTLSLEGWAFNTLNLSFLNTDGWVSQGYPISHGDLKTAQQVVDFWIAQVPMDVKKGATFVVPLNVTRKLAFSGDLPTKKDRPECRVVMHLSGASISRWVSFPQTPTQRIGYSKVKLVPYGDRLVTDHAKGFKQFKEMLLRNLSDVEKGRGLLTDRPA